MVRKKQAKSVELGDDILLPALPYSFVPNSDFEACQSPPSQSYLETREKGWSFVTNFKLKDYDVQTDPNAQAFVSSLKQRIRTHNLHSPFLSHKLGEPIAPRPARKPKRQPLPGQQRSPPRASNSRLSLLHSPLSRSTSGVFGDEFDSRSRPHTQASLARSLSQASLSRPQSQARPQSRAQMSRPSSQASPTRPPSQTRPHSQSLARPSSQARPHSQIQGRPSLSRADSRTFSQWNTSSEGFALSPYDDAGMCTLSKKMLRWEEPTVMNHAALQKMERSLALLDQPSMPQDVVFQHVVAEHSVMDYLANQLRQPQKQGHESCGGGGGGGGGGGHSSTLAVDSQEPRSTLAGVHITPTIEVHKPPNVEPSLTSLEEECVSLYVSFSPDACSERDYLCKYVFPGVVRFACERNLHLRVVDLRFGGADGKEVPTASIALASVDACRLAGKRFFLAVVGSRLDMLADADANTVSEEQYKWVEEPNFKTLGLQALEIHHACLRSPQESTAAVFVRDAAFMETEAYKDLPVDVKQSLLPSTALESRHRSMLVEAVTAASFVHTYGCVVDEPASRSQNALKLSELHVFGLSVRKTLEQAIEAYRPAPRAHFGNQGPSQMQHSLALLRKLGCPAYCPRTDITRAVSDYLEGSSRRICALVGPSGSGKSTLLTHISADYERKLKAVFFSVGMGGSACELHSVLTALLDDISTLLESNATEESRSRSGSPSHGPTKKDHHALIQVPGGGRTLNRFNALNDALEKAAREVIARHGKLVLFLDGLDQLTAASGAALSRGSPGRPGHDAQPSLLSTPLMEGLFVVVAASQFPLPCFPALDAAVVRIGPLDTTQKELIIDRYLGVREAELGRPLVPEEDRQAVAQALCRNPSTSSPFFLTVALAEVEHLPPEALRSESPVPDNLPELLQGILQRLETRHAVDVVAKTLCLLATSRGGMCVHHLRAVLAGAGSDGSVGTALLRDSLWAPLLADLHPLACIVDPGQQLLALRSEAVAAAIRSRLMDGDRRKMRMATAFALSRYYYSLVDPLVQKPNSLDRTKCRAYFELPRLLTTTLQWEELENVLTDVFFVSNKIGLGMVNDLIADYNFAVQTIEKTLAEIISKSNGRETEVAGTKPLETLKSKFDQFRKLVQTQLPVFRHEMSCNAVRSGGSLQGTLTLLASRACHPLTSVMRQLVERSVRACSEQVSAVSSIMQNQLQFVDVGACDFLETHLYMGGFFHAVGQLGTAFKDGARTKHAGASVLQRLEQHRIAERAVLTEHLILRQMLSNEFLVVKDLNKWDKSNWTLLQAAAFCGYLRLTQWLHSHGASADTKKQQVAPAEADTNSDADSAFVNAPPTFLTHDTWLELLSPGTTVADMAALSSWSPVILAAWKGHTTVVHYLVSEVGCDIECLTEGTPDAPPMNALHAAAQAGNVGVVTALLSLGALVNVRDPVSRLTALHLAALHGHVESANEILRHPKADTTTRDVLGRSVLHVAALSGNVKITQLLLNRRANTSLDLRDNDGRTPLHYCAEKGHWDVVKILVSRGADFNLKDSSNSTPVHILAKKGNDAVARLFISMGRLDLNIQDDETCTPVHYAMLAKHYALVDLFLHRHANDVNVNVNSRVHATLLHLAAASGDLKRVQFLVDRCGADVNILDHNRESAAMVGLRLHHMDIVAFLVDKGTDVCVLSKVDAMSMLHYATFNGHLGLLQKMVDSGSFSLDFKDGKGMTPLQLAMKHNHLAVMQYLVMAGAEPNVRLGPGPGNSEDGDGQLMPLHIAASRGNAAMVSCLIQKGHAVDAAYDQGVTALHLASDRAEESIVDVLLRSSANAMCNATFQHKLYDRPIAYTSPLHLLAINGSLHGVKALCVAGASVSSKDELGRTPLSLALESGSMPCIRYLVERGADGVAARGRRCSKRGWGRGGDRVQCLHFAAIDNDVQFMRVLMLAGAKFDDPDTDAWISLHYASEAGSLDVVEFLLRQHLTKSQNANATKFQATVASVKDSQQSQKAVVPSVAGVNSVTTTGNLTCLHLAAMNGHLAVVDRLIKAGADLNLEGVDVEGGQPRTALAMAIANNQNAVAEFLIVHKAQ